MSGVIIQPEDQKYFRDDPNFNPERNKAIIAETIAETEKYFAEMRRGRINEDGEERMDVLSSYGTYKFHKGKDGSLKQYLGRDLYNRLTAEKILERVRIADSISRLKSNKTI